MLKAVSGIKSEAHSAQNRRARTYDVVNIYFHRGGDVTTVVCFCSQNNSNVMEGF